jgi:succinoglycan biosynthesis protein ExoM
LLLALEQYQADVVSGPVLPSFSDDVPDWVKQDGYFEPPNYETGQVIEWCATNNALVARRVFDLVPQFDERFQLSGADDMHFFGRVSRAGFKIVWSRKAKVSEVIAADRANLGWILRRSYRGGNCSVLVASALDRRITPKLIRFLKATGRIVQGISETGTALFRGKVQLARSLRHVYLGFGMLAGLVDLKYQAYKITTGE